MKSSNWKFTDEQGQERNYRGCRGVTTPPPPQQTKQHISQNTGIFLQGNNCTAGQRKEKYHETGQKRTSKQGKKSLLVRRATACQIELTVLAGEFEIFPQWLLQNSKSVIDSGGGTCMYVGTVLKSLVFPSVSKAYKLLHVGSQIFKLLHFYVEFNAKLIELWNSLLTRSTYNLDRAQWKQNWWHSKIKVTENFLKQIKGN